MKSATGHAAQHEVSSSSLFVFLLIAFGLAWSLLRAGIPGICLVLALWSGAAHLTPRAHQPIDAPATVFPADRAMVDVGALTAAPRPGAVALGAPHRAPIIEVQVQAGAAIVAAAIGGQGPDLADFAPAAEET